jgi:hypothetical protein
MPQRGESNGVHAAAGRLEGAAWNYLLINDLNGPKVWPQLEHGLR